MSNNDRPMLQAMDACDSGRHKLEPRYDFAKVGDIVKRTYVCEVCPICGHQVLAPFTAQQQLEAGVVDAEEVREAMRLVGITGYQAVTLEQALAVVVAHVDEVASDSKERTSEAPRAGDGPSGVTGKA
jgi:hypothetical protein